MSSFFIMCTGKSCVPVSSDLFSVLFYYFNAFLYLYIFIVYAFYILHLSYFYLSFYVFTCTSVYIYKCKVKFTLSNNAVGPLLISTTSVAAVNSGFKAN